MRRACHKPRRSASSLVRLLHRGLRTRKCPAPDSGTSCPAPGAARNTCIEPASDGPLIPPVLPVE